MGQISLPPELQTKKVKSLSGDAKKLVEDLLAEKFDIKEEVTREQSRNSFRQAWGPGKFAQEGVGIELDSHVEDGRRFRCGGPCCSPRSGIPATAWREAESFIRRNLRISSDCGIIQATAEIRMYEPETGQRFMFAIGRAYNEFMMDRRVDPYVIQKDMMREYEMKVRTYPGQLYIDI